MIGAARVGLGDQHRRTSPGRSRRRRPGRRRSAWRRRRRAPGSSSAPVRPRSRAGRTRRTRRRRRRRARASRRPAPVRNASVMLRLRPQIARARRANAAGTLGPFGSARQYACSGGQRELAGRRVVADVAARGLAAQPLGEIPRVAAGALGELPRASPGPRASARYSPSRWPMTTPPVDPVAPRSVDEPAEERPSPWWCPFGSPSWSWPARCRPRSRKRGGPARRLRELTAGCHRLCVGPEWPAVIPPGMLSEACRATQRRRLRPGGGR